MSSIAFQPFRLLVISPWRYPNSMGSGATDQYYWEAYHVLGDGSICPYHTNPIANTVTHLPVLAIGLDTYTVSADPGSYVGISKDGILYGVGEIGETGTADIPIAPITAGEVKLVVTHPQRQPYVTTIIAAPLEGAFIAVDSYTPANAHVGDESNLSITFKNVGVASTEGTTNVTLSCDDENLTFINGTGSFDNLAPEATVTLSGFTYRIAQGVDDGTRFTINATAVCGSDTWVGKAFITAGEAVLSYDNMSWAGTFIPGETVSVMASFKNVGHYMATNAIASIASSSQYVSFTNDTYEVGTIDPSGVATCVFNVTFAANCPETEQISVTFTLNADGGLTAEGTVTLSNSCNIVFDLADSYGDGWDGSKVTVSFSDGTPSQDMTITDGSSATYVIQVGNGVEVTLTWTSNSFWWDSECSIHVHYEDGDDICFITNPNSGVLYTFVCACGGGSSAQLFDPVQNLNATIEDYNIVLTWEQPTNGTPNQYIVYRNGIEIGQTNETSYTDIVSEEITYTYCLVAEYPTGYSTPECVFVEFFEAISENEVEFDIYPNPVNGILFVNGGNAEYSYEMYNGVGQKVAEGKVTGNTQINVNGMTKGVYFLRLISGTQVRMNKVVVE